MTEGYNMLSLSKNVETNVLHTFLQHSLGQLDSSINNMQQQIHVALKLAFPSLNH